MVATVPATDVDSELWGADTGLRVRMVLSLVLLVALPVAFVYTFVFAMNTVGVELLRWMTDSHWRGQFYVRPWLVGLAVVVGFAVQYVYGEGMALRSTGARRVDADEYPDLHESVTRLSSQVGLPTPSIAVVSTDVPNAFTVGRSPAHATVVVTTGLLESLDEDERDAVLAHELAHVGNRDVAVMTLAYFLPTLTYFVAIGAYLFLSKLFHALGGMHFHDEDDAKGFLILLAVLVVSTVVTLAISVLFWLGSYLLFRVLSQYREYAADRAAAAITGDPLALASALQTLDDEMSALPDEDLRTQDGGVEALYVAPIDTYQFDADRELISSDVFPETHPPIEERIERLQDLATEAERR